MGESLNSSMCAYVGVIWIFCLSVQTMYGFYHIQNERLCANFKKKFHFLFGLHGA